MKGNGAFLRVARWVDATEAEGPYLRAAIWVQGCPIRCPGCCNEDLFPPDGGTVMDGPAMEARLRSARDRLAIEGITCLGGEPLAQPRGVAALARAARHLGLGVIVFSGYSGAGLERRLGEADLARWVDTLVPGPFRPGVRAPAAAHTGSANQIPIHLTPRYADPSWWTPRLRAEVRIVPGEPAAVVGLPPAVDAVRSALEAGSPRPRFVRTRRRLRGPAPA